VKEKEIESGCCHGGKKKWKPYNDKVMAKLCKKWKKNVGVWKRKRS
jgi:hypothetical protein